MFGSSDHSVPINFVVKVLNIHKGQMHPEGFFPTLVKNDCCPQRSNGIFNETALAALLPKATDLAYESRTTYQPDKDSYSYWRNCTLSGTVVTSGGKQTLEKKTTKPRVPLSKVDLAEAVLLCATIPTSWHVRCIVSIVTKLFSHSLSTNGLYLWLLRHEERAGVTLKTTIRVTPKYGSGQQLFINYTFFNEK